MLNQQDLKMKIIKAEELKNIANLWFKAFNEQNLDDLLSLYDESAQHLVRNLKLENPTQKV